MTRNEKDALLNVLYKLFRSNQINYIMTLNF